MRFRARESAFDRKLNELREAQHAEEHQFAQLREFVTQSHLMVEAACDVADGAITAALSVGKGVGGPATRQRQAIDRLRQQSRRGRDEMIERITKAERALWQ